MANLAEIESRLATLEDVEAIKKLKYKYLRALDLQLWDVLAETLTEDVTTEYMDGQYRYQGRGNVIKFISESFTPQSTWVYCHHCHHPEIEITSATTAKGIWALWNYHYKRDEHRGLLIVAHYYDEYVKLDGQWKVKHTGYKQVLQEEWDRADIPSLRITYDRLGGGVSA